MTKAISYLSMAAVPNNRSNSCFDQQIPAGCDEYHSETERATYI
jgi:hypothetical protein